MDFEPAEFVIDEIIANTTKDFIASPISISGYVLNEQGDAVPNIAIKFYDEADLLTASLVSGTDGFYSFAIPAEWKGTAILPYNDAVFLFEPQSRNYHDGYPEGVNISLTAQNYIAKTRPRITSFKINSGAPGTGASAVTLNITATGSPVFYKASENSALTDAQWLAYSSSPQFTFSTTGHGIKKVYLKIKNVAGVESIIANDVIYYGTVPRARFYYLKDHLGTVKMTVNETGEVVGYNDYYPYGMVMDGRSQNSADPSDYYKFTGKERDKETNYDYFGARYYDSRIGRWLQPDPLAANIPGGVLIIML